MWKVIDLNKNRKCEAKYDLLEDLYEEYKDDLGHEDRLIEQRSNGGEIEASIGMVSFFNKYDECNLPERLPLDKDYV